MGNMIEMFPVVKPPPLSLKLEMETLQRGLGPAGVCRGSAESGEMLMSHRQNKLGRFQMYFEYSFQKKTVGFNCRTRHLSLCNSKMKLSDQTRTPGR